MVNLLIQILGPFFYGLGVSEADLEMYLTQLSGYLYAIFAFLIVMIIVMIAAVKAKKGVRCFIRWQAALAFVAVFAIIINVVCYGPMYNNVSGFLNAANVVISDESKENSEKVIQQTGEEGMVLVKNTGLLPLNSSVQKLNIFGWDSTNPLFGGTGSGGSDTSNAVGIIDSFQNAGYQTNETLTEMYINYRADRPTVALAEQDWTLPEPTADYYTDEIMTEAEEFSDTAVIVIGRPSGENADLPTDMNAVIHGTYNPAEQDSIMPQNYGYMNGSYTNNGDYDDFEEGESYLELSRTEEDLVELVCSSFDNVIVIINANNPMELGWVDDYDQIGAVILAPGAGQTGFTALGEIVSGEINPSGRTVDTYVKDLFTTPYINNIGNHSYTNVDDLKQQIAEADSTYEGNMAFVNYVEGIYVGYKYYETAYDEGILSFEDEVQYPFGYGLSCTTFDKSIESFTENDESVSFDVVVSNTGNVAGKDVVEIYYTPPYTNGGIEKASVKLIDFEKTDLLEPGASQTISFTIAKEDMASYDSDGIKIEGGGYILEAGDYTISLRSDSHTVVDEVTFTVSEDVDYSENGRSSDQTAAVNQFQDYSRGDFVQLSRADHFANYEDACGAPDESQYIMSEEVRAEVEEDAYGIYDSSLYDDSDAEMPVMEADNGLTLFDLKGADYEDELWDQLLDQMSFEDMSTLINAGGWQTAAIDSIGKIATSDCDGPAGLNNLITLATGTAYPAEVLMSQTWSKEIAYKIGQAMGQEFKDANNYGWYGPAMNTHRSAFGGRNFEYYSEDGVLAGKFAVNEINGAAESGVYAYLKHFAVNDQEINRCSFLLTFASEQAIREIYLKPFELAVKGFEGKAQAIMTAFNFIGTEPCFGNEHLLKNVLREEWGFTGMVETDYDGGYGFMITDHCIRSGNDMMLGFNVMESNVLRNDSASLVQDMRQTCKNILYTVVNSGAYAGEDDPSDQMTNMTKIFLATDISVVLVIILIEIILILRLIKRRKNA